MADENVTKAGNPSGGGGQTTLLSKIKLPMKEKIAYGLGDVGNGFLFDLGQIYLLKFYTDVLGLPALWAGSVFLLSKIFDAVSDMTVGTLIDSRKHIGKRGKFRPFMLYGLLPLGLMTVACFTNPDFSVTGKLIYAYATYILFGLTYSIVNIPYGSIAASMTQDPIERTQLAAFRQCGSNTGLLITTVAFMPIVTSLPDQEDGYKLAVGIFSVLGIAILYYCYAHIHERIIVERPKEEHPSLKRSFKAIFQNTPLLLLCLVNLFTFSAFNVKLAVQVYYCQYSLNDVSLVPYMGFFSIGCVFVGIACVTKAVKLLGGKKEAYIFGAAVWAVGDLINYFFVTTPFMFIVFSCVAFFGSSFINSLNWAFVADAVEYGEWRTGVRSEGIVYSFFTFFRKLSQAVAGFVPGLVLGLVGYVPNAVQSATALAGIKALMFIYPSVLAIATIIVMGKFYKLSDRWFQKIVADLQQKHLAELQNQRK